MTDPAPPYPCMDEGGPLNGTETITARQDGMLRRFKLALLKPWIDFGTVTVSETMALAVGASVRTVLVTCKGIKAGALVTVFPASSMPAGFGLTGAVCVADDTVNVSVACPALALGVKYNISARVLVARM